MMSRNMAKMKPFISKIIICILSFIGCILTSNAQILVSNGQNWTAEEAAYRGNYFLTDMAIETADHVLMYQMADGGWPKGIYYPAHLNATDIAKVPEIKKQQASSLSGKTTLTEIHFLSNMYQATARKKYKKAVEALEVA